MARGVTTGEEASASLGRTRAVLFDAQGRLITQQGDPAFGLAGKCGVLSIQGDYKGSNTAYSQLVPIRSKLNSRPMAELVAHAVKRKDSQLHLQTAREWDTWFKDQFPDGG